MTFGRSGTKLARAVDTRDAMATLEICQKNSETTETGSWYPSAGVELSKSNTQICPLLMCLARLISWTTSRGNHDARPVQQITHVPSTFINQSCRLTTQ